MQFYVLVLMKMNVFLRWISADEYLKNHEKLRHEMAKHYDYLVIGRGSGGIASAKRAAR